MAALVVAVAALSGVVETISAKPPTAPTQLPPQAFSRVDLPNATALATPRTSIPTTRVPDGGLSEPSRSAGATPAPEVKPPAGPVHVVRRGETLWQIAAWHRANVDLILLWNAGADPRGLVAGQRILVPGGKPMAALPPAQAPSRSGGAPSGGTGPHLWPLTIRGTITTRFSTAHPGIDIAAHAGTPVRAIAAGTIAWAGWKNNGGGFVVVIRHPDGMVSTYNHNREVTVRVGQVVASGEPIAAVGATGLATGPHLDLRIEMGGDLINPLRLEWAR